MHSAFFNLEGERYIGQPWGKPNICLEAETVTLLDGRRPHCGLGRTGAQGSHVIVHVFVRVCSTSVGVWESLSVEQQDNLWRTLPDIVERGGLVDNLDWPKSGKYLHCARCCLRRPAFICGKCDQECCLVCTVQSVCSVCESKSTKKRPRRGK